MSDASTWKSGVQPPASSHAQVRGMSRPPHWMSSVTSSTGGGVVELELEVDDEDDEDDEDDGDEVDDEVGVAGVCGVSHGPRARPSFAPAVRSSRSPDSRTSLLRTVTRTRSWLGL